MSPASAPFEHTFSVLKPQIGPKNRVTKPNAASVHKTKADRIAQVVHTVSIVEHQDVPIVGSQPDEEAQKMRSMIEEMLAPHISELQALEASTRARERQREAIFELNRDIYNIEVSSLQAVKAKVETELNDVVEMKRQRTVLAFKFNKDKEAMLERWKHEIERLRRSGYFPDQSENDLETVKWRVQKVENKLEVLDLSTLCDRINGRYIETTANITASASRIIESASQDATTCCGLACKSAVESLERGMLMCLEFV